METGVRGSGFRSEETTPSPPAHSDVRSRRRVIVERVWPEIDGGRFPIKRSLGETVTVSADIFADGHDLLAGVVKYRALCTGGRIFSASAKATAARRRAAGGGRAAPP